MTSKTELRAAIAASRARRTPSELHRDRAGIRAQVLPRCLRELAPGARVAGYRPLRTEPGSLELLEELEAAGYQVIVPVTLPDRDLDWAPFGAPGGQTLGLDAIGTASLLLVPAFAVDAHGNRLGRGSGSYDRALSRVADTVPVAALLFAGELLPEVPTEPWDRPVTAAITPAGWVDLTPTGRRNTS